jgi:hypothetical protein
MVPSGDDRRERASFTPAPMRPLVPMPVSIYRPAGNAVQSGRANTKRWVLEFEPTSPPEIEPLMGWLSSTDTQKHVRLTFPTRESPSSAGVTVALFFKLWRLSSLPATNGWNRSLNRHAAGPSWFINSLR